MQHSTSVVVHEEQYYALKPIKNDVYLLLEDLKNYRVTLRSLGAELERRDIAKRLPEQLKQLQIIIEFQDFIIQARDLLEYQLMVDDNQKGIGSDIASAPA